MNQEGCNMKHVQQFSIILLISVIWRITETFTSTSGTGQCLWISIIMLVAFAHR